MSLLDSVGDFRGLYGLGEDELGALCAELRERILDVTLKNGGHLSSSLGAVELTVALLRVFNPDSDKIIFDVGHQSYAYKLLTKRLDRFPTLRARAASRASRAWTKALTISSRRATAARPSPRLWATRRRATSSAKATRSSP